MSTPALLFPRLILPAIGLVYVAFVGGGKSLLPARRRPPAVPLSHIPGKGRDRRLEFRWARMHLRTGTTTLPTSSSPSFGTGRSALFLAHGRDPASTVLVLTQQHVCGHNGVADALV